ncbi:MAG: hypothetical protein FJW36_02155 [Acidobacteria bacterium]|nr:hypothetical protein [Acidobacteriota bacterium]
MQNQSAHQEVRALLKALPRRRATHELSLDLHISASKEAARRQKWASAPALLVRMNNTFQLWKTNMARPLALPCAGGIVSAVVVFAMFVHIHPVRANSLADDRPTALYTEPAAKTLAPFEPPTADAEIEVSIDEQGRVADYRVVEGNLEMNLEVRRSVERTLLFTEFVPATSFGQAIPSKLRLSLRRGASAITVKG